MEHLRRCMTVRGALCSFVSGLSGESTVTALNFSDSVTKCSEPLFNLGQLFHTQKADFFFFYYFFFGGVSFWEVGSSSSHPLHVPAPTCPLGMSVCLIPANCIWSTKRELSSPLPPRAPAHLDPFFLSVMQPRVSLTDSGWARCDRLPLCSKHKHLKHLSCTATCQCMQLKTNGTFCIGTPNPRGDVRWSSAVL